MFLSLILIKLIKKYQIYLSNILKMNLFNQIILFNKLLIQYYKHMSKLEKLKLKINQIKLIMKINFKSYHKYMNMWF